MATGEMEATVLANENSNPSVDEFTPVISEDDDTSLLNLDLDESSRGTLVDEDNTTRPPKPPKQRRRGLSSDLSEVVEVFAAEKLYEYQWPPDSGEFYMLQEQVSEFLKVKSFKRKYPELSRRLLFANEKDFLREGGVVNETQSNLGLTALVSEEVCDLMMKDFPEQYRDYVTVLQEREKQKLTEQQAYKPTGKSLTDAMSSDRMKEYVACAAKQAAAYNSALMKKRRTDRQAYFDLQTQVIHFPQGKYKVLPPEATDPGAYPVALIPGQYQNYTKTYTPAELNYLPLKSVIYGPVSCYEDNRLAPPNAFNESLSDDSISLSGSDSDNSETRDPQCPSEDAVDTPAPRGAAKVTEQPDPPPVLPEESSVIPNQPKTKTQRDKSLAVCSSCSRDKKRNKFGRPEELAHCSQCDNSVHPSCLEMSPEIGKAIKSYDWQCNDCKRCTKCNDPHDEDKMLFCDVCDRGYHIFCVGIKTIPCGRWVCEACGTCTSCYSRNPGTERGKWIDEFTKPRDGTKPQYVQTVCTPCHRLFEAGYFCPVCLKAYSKDTVITMVWCNTCGRYIHPDCDCVPGGELRKSGKNKGNNRCVICRSQKQERLDTFHKKYTSRK